MNLADRLAQFSAAKDTLLQSLTHLLVSRKPDVPRLIPEPTRSGTSLSFDGTPIYWELHGPEKSKAVPMVFCYGLVCSMNQWRYQLDRYSQKHPCLLLDYRGHHRSGSPKDPQLMNIGAAAKDVATCIKEIGFTKPAHVWGHSMGVNVALELAAADPALVASLVLCCGTLNNPFDGMFGSNVLEKVTDPFIKAYPENKETYHLMWRLTLSQPKLSKIISGLAGFNEKASEPRDLDAYVKAVASIDPSTFFPLLIEMSRGMGAHMASRIKQPAAVIAGGLDHVTPPPAQKSMAESLGDASYIEIPTGSHNVQLDFGEYVCLKVEEFWKAHNL